MAGRPRIYANAAEKTRAYRERLEQQNQNAENWFEHNEADMRRLRCSIYAAQKRGDRLALSLEPAIAEGLIEDLAIYFESGQVAQRPMLPQETKERSRNKNAGG